MRRLRKVTFMTTDPERLASFWAEALGLPERKYSPEERDGLTNEHRGR